MGTFCYFRVQDSAIIFPQYLYKIKDSAHQVLV